MDLTFEAPGIHGLRLKSALQNRIGSSFSVNGRELTIPFRCIHAVHDILPEDVRNTDVVRKAVSVFNMHERSRLLAMQAAEDGSTEGLINPWHDVLEPAQASAVAAMVQDDLLGLCLFDEQGSGKTVMTIAAFDILKERGSVDGMIVICPKSMVEEWPKDLHRFLQGKYRTVTAEGDHSKKRNAALTDFDVLITNYESLAHINIALKAKAQTKSFLLTVDESFYLKNSEAVRSEQTADLRGVCSRCFVLCGTPAPNSPYDLINQFDLADLGYTFAGFGKTENLDDDKRRIEETVATRGTYLRRLKTDILSFVPEKNFNIVMVLLEGRQARMYQAAKSELELTLRNMDNTTFKRSLATYFQKRQALLQICSSPSSIDPTFAGENAKLKPLDELVDRLVAEERKVVIWSYYSQNLIELYERYRRHNPVRIYGGVPEAERKRAISAFQNDPETKIFIGNPAAAGAGITLHAAYDAIYVSFSNQAAHYLQSLDRIHRRGQKALEVNYYLLICERTIEESEVKRLRRKELQQNGLFGDQVVFPSSLDEALDELSDTW